MNQIKIFEKAEEGFKIRTVLNEDGSISVNTEDAAIGFGWCKTEMKNGKEYMSIRWERVNGFSAELGFAHEWSKDDYIPESLYYLLGMKASSEQALKYQMWIATEVLPSVRKHGMYATDQVIDRMVEDPDFGIQLLTTLKEEKAKRKELEHENSVMKPKAEYFDALVDWNLLTSFRDTAKELGIRERKFLDFLKEEKYIYRDQGGKLRPFAAKNGGLFELKEFNNNGHPGVQTMITPKGRETFRLLLEKYNEVTA